jgi:hypothetical protein
MHDTTAQLDVSNSASRDKFLSNTSRTLPQTHRGITLEYRPGIDALRDTSTPRRNEQDSGLIPRGGLAPWQVCRVLTHIEAHLGASISTAELANWVKSQSLLLFPRAQEKRQRLTSRIHNATASRTDTRTDADNNDAPSTDRRELRSCRSGKF